MDEKEKNKNIKQRLGNAKKANKSDRIGNCAWRRTAVMFCSRIPSTDQYNISLEPKTYSLKHVRIDKTVWYRSQRMLGGKEKRRQLVNLKKGAALEDGKLSVAASGSARQRCQQLRPFPPHVRSSDV